MPLSALPTRLQSPSAWKGTDWDTWYQRWMLQYIGWFAYGPRATERWARWRALPKVLLAIGGKGTWRWEYDDGSQPELSEWGKTPLKLDAPVNYYLSRVQYWKRWHFAVQWPLQITFHVYWRASDVPTAFTRPDTLGISKFFSAYGPVSRDADRVYWFPGFFVGGEWK